MSKHTTDFQDTRAKALGRGVLFVLLVIGQYPVWGQQQTGMVRLSEIEIHPVYLKEYNAILAEEAAASVKLEPGVIAIFPMHQKENPTSVRILEMYADRAAYEQHLKTAHFQRYKTTTRKMVKSLKLVDMEAMDAATMSAIFRKLEKGKR